MSPYMRFTRLIGMFLGLAALLVCLLLDVEHAVLWSIIIATAFMLAFYPLVRYLAYRNDRKYAEFEATLSVPFFHCMNGNIRLGNRLRNGNLYFLDNGILLASLDETPRLVELLALENIERVTFHDVHMHIHTKDGRIFDITSPDTDLTHAALKKRNWVY